jgi:DNA-binding XRE family transcriptional regulator
LLVDKCGLKKPHFVYILAKQIHLATMPQVDLTNAHKEIGKQLYKLRKAARKSIAEAATDAGIMPRTLAKIEDGEVNFRILTLGKLCRAYNVTLEELLEDSTLGQRAPPSKRRKPRQ